MKFTNSLRTSMYTTIGALLLTLSSFAQAPEKMSYQAVVRGANNALVTNQQVGMQISILQGSTAVYEETQTPTSNKNGLVSLEIGKGTIVSGIFSSIDWSADMYFIKIETDPAGGTNYTITGTSQLLSVPYALYAKTSSDTEAVAANTAKVGITTEQATAIVENTSKTGITTQQADAITTNTAKVGYTEALVSANTHVAANTAKVGITTEQATAILENTSKTGGITTHFIGESYGGGIVFFVYDGGQHGLIAATADQSAGVRWSGGSYTNTRARADGIGAGLKNTAIIIADQGPVDNSGTGNDFAATLCNEYSVTVDGVTYGDWYLPSKYELNQMYINRSTLEAVSGFNAFTTSFYWSSTEKDTHFAWRQYFHNGAQDGDNKANTSHRVRAVRAF